MSINHKTKTLLCIIPITILVGLYQLPVVENTANKYDLGIDINEKFPYSKDFQQSLEEEKISLLSYLDQPIYIQSSEKKSNIHLASMQVQKIDEIISHKEEIIQPNIIANSGLQTNQQTNNVICVDKCKILMLGDSVMGDVSFALQRLLKQKKSQWEVINAHKVSSGLSNQNYYNWPATAKKLIEQYKPDYTYVLIGTNDAQSFASNGKGYAFGKSDWVNEYGSRVQKITDLLANNNGNWGWIQLPVVRESGFNNKLQVIRNIQQNNTKEHFILTENVFGKVDNNTNIDMKLRANDGIHLNATGANKLAKMIYEKIKPKEEI